MVSTGKNRYIHTHTYIITTYILIFVSVITYILLYLIIILISIYISVEPVFKVDCLFLIEHGTPHPDALNPNWCVGVKSHPR